MVRFKNIFRRGGRSLGKKASTSASKPINNLSQNLSRQPVWIDPRKTYQQAHVQPSTLSSSQSLGIHPSERPAQTANPPSRQHPPEYAARPSYVKPRAQSSKKPSGRVLGTLPNDRIGQPANPPSGQHPHPEHAVRPSRTFYSSQSSSKLPPVFASETSLGASSRPSTSSGKSHSSSRAAPGSTAFASEPSTSIPTQSSRSRSSTRSHSSARAAAGVAQISKEDIDDAWNRGTNQGLRDPQPLVPGTQPPRANTEPVGSKIHPPRPNGQLPRSYTAPAPSGAQHFQQHTQTPRSRVEPPPTINKAMSFAEIAEQHILYELPPRDVDVGKLTYEEKKVRNSLLESRTKLRVWRDLQARVKKLGYENKIDEGRLIHMLRYNFHIYVVRHPDPGARQLLKQIDNFHLQPNEMPYICRPDPDEHLFKR